MKNSIDGSGQSELSSGTLAALPPKEKILKLQGVLEEMVRWLKDDHYIPIFPILPEALLNTVGRNKDYSPMVDTKVSEACSPVGSVGCALMGALTDKELEAITNRESLATKGPWKEHYGYNNGGMATGFFHIPAHNSDAQVEMLADDAAFCAHAREDIPKLLAEVERLKAEERLWRHAVSDMFAKAEDESTTEAEGEAIIEHLQALLRTGTPPTSPPKE